MMKYLKIFTPKFHYEFIVVLWVAAAVLGLVYLLQAGHPFKIGETSNPLAESTLAQNTIKKIFPYSGSSLFIFYENNKLTVNNADFESYINKSLSHLKNLSFKNRVTSPYKNSKQISENKHAAYAVMETNLSADKLASSIDEIRNALGKSNKFTTLLGGEAAFIADVTQLSKSNLIRGELIALPICFIAMIFIFGSLTSALVTIASGIISIIIINACLNLLGHYIDLSIYVVNIASLLGLGLCLDYSLLIIYRFHEEWPCYTACKPTIRITLENSGRAIIFSGFIFLISMASLMFFPNNVLRSMGIASIFIVSITMLCSLTFIPSMLCLVVRGHPDVTRANQSSEGEIENHNWYQLALLVMKYPFVFCVGVILILVFLGYPFLNVKLNNSDAKVLPAWTESRKIVDNFEKYFNAEKLEPMIILFKAKDKNILNRDNIAALYDYAQRLKKDTRVKNVSSIVSMNSTFNKKEYQQLYQSSKLPFNDYETQVFHSIVKGRYTVMNVTSKYSKDDKRNAALVKTIRNNSIGNHITKQVTGFSANTLDSIDSIYQLFFKIVIFISIVTYLALLFLLRSLILPLKAIVMNLLSLSVCYGMLVFIFQEGHFARLLGFESVGFTDMNLPILIFFVLYGLSMDYEIFLLARIHEFYVKTKDNTLSIALGIERSAKIITSAAVILVIVSSAFVTSDLVFIKAFGLSVALAIIVDTTLIRLLLVPATMRLFGDSNWYIPKWLDRVLPKFNFHEEPKCKI